MNLIQKTATAVALTTAFSTAQAGLINFDDVDTGVYNNLVVDGIAIESQNGIGYSIYEQNGHKFLGNHSNTDKLIFTREDGGLFSLDSFDVASRVEPFDVALSGSLIDQNSNAIDYVFDIEDTAYNFQTITDFDDQVVSSFSIGINQNGAFGLDNFNTTFFYPEDPVVGGGDEGTVSVNEPGSLVLAGLGILGIVGSRRKMAANAPKPQAV